MPRDYESAPGAKSRRNYATEDMERAIAEVKKQNGKGISQAARDHNVPRSTLYDKWRGFHQKDLGGQQRLSKELELLIVSSLNTLAKWKIPLTGLDIRLLVKDYLDQSGMQDIFTDNMPGPDWLRLFMKRHNLTRRRAANVTHVRGKVKSEEMEKYFDNLEQELQNIPPSNIFNYDETMISDDPGCLHAIVSRGARRVERIIAHSRSSTSVMFCGSADGNFLPPMVIYKCQSRQVYEGWIDGGPKDAVYGATESGWMDRKMFEKWFFELFLPAVQKLDGEKVLIGDNLGSHFSPKVIEATVLNNIKFIMLPTNSTHLTQPLDVSVFHPLKVCWRRILEQWRIQSRHSGCIPKTQLPGLLARLWKKLNGDHLMSGFSKAGIYPCDRTKVLQEIPEHAPIIDTLLCNSLLEEKIKAAYSIAKSTSTPRRGKKVNHEPGQRITSLQKKDPNVCGFADCEDGPYDKKKWRWIACDNCETWFHLHCSGFDYDVKDYYKMNLDIVDFSCDDCIDL